jgi:hypothetical protein
MPSGVVVNVAELVCAAAAPADVPPPWLRCELLFFELSDDEDDEEERLLLLLLWRLWRFPGLIVVASDLRNVSCRRLRSAKSVAKGWRRRCCTCCGVSGGAISCREP